MEVLFLVLIFFCFVEGYGLFFDFVFRVLCSFIEGFFFLRKLKFGWVGMGRGSGRT